MSRDQSHDMVMNYRRLRTQFAIILGVLTVLAFILIVRFLRPSPLGPVHGPVLPPVNPPVNPEPLAPIEIEVIRLKSWDKVLPYIDEADKSAESRVSENVARVDQFFVQRKEGTRAFAEEVLSLRGKWALVHANLPYFGESNEYSTFLNSKFDKYIFTPDELKRVIESSVANHVYAVRETENQLLVKIRQDLSGAGLKVAQALPFLRTEEIFGREYEKAMERVGLIVEGDTKREVLKEVVSFVAANVAARLGARLGAVVGSKLAVSGGILAAGASSSWASFGIGLVAAIVVDLALDKIIRLFSDPEAEVANKINGTLDRVRLLLVEGDTDAWDNYNELRRLEREDPVPVVRSACKKNAELIWRGDHLGLRQQLHRLNETRAKIRREAIRNLILKGGEE